MIRVIIGLVCWLLGPRQNLDTKYAAREELVRMINHRWYEGEDKPVSFEFPKQPSLKQVRRVLQLAERFTGQ